MKNKKKNKNNKQIHENFVTNHINLAREGHLIFCYGDCERKYQEAMDSLRESRTGDVMKDIWLDAYNTQSKRISTKSTKPNEPNKR